MSTAERIMPRPEIPDVLQQLRTRIRRYVLWEGVSLVVALLGVVFWVSLAIDYGLEPAGGVRTALLFIAVLGVGAACVWHVVLRLARSLGSRSLALVLERRFPQLNDRLITAVELAENVERPSPLTASMLERAADEAAELARQLRLAEVFDMRPMLKAIGLAAVLSISVAALGLSSAEVFSTWFRRNVLLADELYRRETDLAVFVLAEPGERVVEFQNGVYKHPRGQDFTFLAEVPDGRKVPERVQFSYRNVSSRGGGDDTMTKIGQRQFRQKLSGLHQSVDLWLRGGDYSTRTPLRIEVVEAPQIERLALEALYPEYTGLNALDEKTQSPVRQSVPVLGSQVSLPAGTDFVLAARANKPLRRVRVQTDSFEIAFERGSAEAAVSLAGEAGEAGKAFRVLM